MYFFQLFVVLSWTLKLAFAGRILAVLSVYSHNHITVHMEVLKGLLINGHKVTVLSNKIIDYKHDNFTFFHTNENADFDESAMIKLKTKSVESLLNGFYYIYFAHKNQLKNEHFQNFMKHSEKIDLM